MALRLQMIDARRQHRAELEALPGEQIEGRAQLPELLP